MSMMMESVLLHSNQLLFTIWNFLEIQTLLTSCICVNRSWTRKLWPIPVISNRKKRRKSRSSMLYKRKRISNVKHTEELMNCGITSSYTNYLGTRSHLNLTRLPSLKEVVNGRSIGQLCRMMCNLKEVELNGSHFSYAPILFKRSDYLFCALFTFCPQFTTIEFNSIPLFSIRIMLKQFQNQCQDVSISRSLTVKVRNCPSYYDTTFIWSSNNPHTFANWNCFETITMITAMDNSNLFHLAYMNNMLPTILTLQFSGEFLIKYSTWASLYISSSNVTYFKWLYIPKNAQDKLTICTETSFITNQKWIKQTELPFIHGYPLLKQITMSKCIDDALIEFGFDAFSTIVKQIRSDIVIEYL
jgi:hypothetical protein